MGPPPDPFEWSHFTFFSLLLEFPLFSFQGSVFMLLQKSSNKRVVKVRRIFGTYFNGALLVLST